MSTRSTCALSLLCVVHGCERFAFLAMLPLFVLYLHHHHGFSESSAMLLLGVFQAVSYVGALPAGALTDRHLGPAPGVLLGAALLTIGYGALALERPALLWPALGLMVLGHSFFKPNISALIGGLFSGGDFRRDRGFLLHHLAINIGAMLGPLCAEGARTRDHWARAFVWAAAVMFIGSCVLALGARWVSFLSKPQRTGIRVAGSRPAERAQLRTVWLVCAVAVVFWLTAQQAGSSLVLFAEAHTDRHWTVLHRSFLFGPGHFASLHSLMVVALMPLFMASMAALRHHLAEPSTPAKMIWGYVATAAAFAVLTAAGIHGGDTGRVSPAWLAGCYLFLSGGELLLGPLGMSLLTQIAPPGKTSQVVGLWFAATAVGNVLTGALGMTWGRWPHHRYFALLALLSLGAAVVLLAQLRRLESAIPRAS